MVAFEFFFKNCNNQSNRELTEFLNTNLKIIYTHTKIISEFRLIDKKYEKEFKALKIKSSPVLKHGKKYITTTKDIINYLDKLVNSTPPVNNSNEFINNEYTLEDMQKNLLYEGVKNDGKKLVAPCEEQKNNEEVSESELKRRTDEFNKKRPNPVNFNDPDLIKDPPKIQGIPPKMDMNEPGADNSKGDEMYSAFLDKMGNDF